MEPQYPAEAPSLPEAPLQGRRRIGTEFVAPHERTFDELDFKISVRSRITFSFIAAFGVTLPSRFLWGALFGKPPPGKERSHGFAP
jgi:hypothetical protein